VKFEFVKAQKAQFPVTQMCRTLQVSSSGFYAWSKREKSQRHKDDERLLKLIISIFQASRKTYGSPRIHATLKQQGHNISEKRVARLMQENGIVVRPACRWRCVTTKADPRNAVAKNELNRDFSATAVNEKWVTDVTFVPTDEGWLYLASMIDLYNREVVGWAMGEHNDTALTLNALDMALEFRNPPEGLIHHSDRGSTYTATDYRDALSSRGIECSMSRKGNCWDNAVSESFFATIKKELIHRFKFSTRREAAAAIFEYIEVFYNRVRKHSQLGYVSPAEFKRNNRAASVAA